jgi:peptidoglycan-associated lipoprotein
MAEKYDEAVEEFNEYLKNATDPVRKELAENEKIGCEFAKVAKKADDVQVLNAGKEVNTKNSEYSPFLTNDNKEIYFTSLVTDEIIEIDEKNNDYHSKIYKSTMGEKGWSKPTALDENINRPGVFNVNVSLSPDGKRMFFNREILEGQILSKAYIYMSENKGGSWGPAERLKSIDTTFLAKSPAVGELFGREVLFFVSDMDGGEGGYDIYYSTYKGNGEYDLPKNLGPKINTVGDEDTPFYRDGALYFSSTGHPGMGGYDIFMSTWNGTMWSKPQNMGRGYNSSVDDLYFMLDKEGYHGMLASNRISEGAKSLKGKTCCNDIYNVILKKITVDLAALTYDLDTKEPLPGATVELIETSNGVTKVLTSKTNSGGNNFEFPLELDKAYKVIASADNYSNDTMDFNTLGLFDSKTISAKLELKPGRKTIKIKREEAFVLENILYEFDDDKIMPVAEPDLNLVYELMKQYPDMVIELSSHTDTRGADEYNRNLSQRRAESARRWLTAKGIERKRIEAKGYGETMPQTVSAKAAAKYPFLKQGTVLTDEVINALLPDSAKFEAAHFLNRRTEFKIIAGPTSIIIEEEKLIQIGNRQVDGQEPPKPQPPKKDDKKGSKKPAPNKNRRNNDGGGDSILQLPKIPAEPKKDSLKIDKLSSLFGKKDLKGLPIMHFDQRVFDMGKVKKGEVREHTFTYTNMGDAPLEIDIISVCECTTYEYSPRTVQPGGKGKITVTFDSNKKEESDTSDVDIYLKNIDPETGAPIFERVQYKFELIQG